MGFMKNGIYRPTESKGCKLCGSKTNVKNSYHKKICNNCMKGKGFGNDSG